jgi:hypothetical protein
VDGWMDGWMDGKGDRQLRRAHGGEGRCIQETIKKKKKPGRSHKEISLITALKYQIKYSILEKQKSKIFCHIFMFRKQRRT